MSKFILTRIRQPCLDRSRPYWAEQKNSEGTVSKRVIQRERTSEIPAEFARMPIPELCPSLLNYRL